MKAGEKRFIEDYLSFFRGKFFAKFKVSPDNSGAGFGKPGGTASEKRSGYSYRCKHTNKIFFVWRSNIFGKILVIYRDFNDGRYKYLLKERTIFSSIYETLNSTQRLEFIKEVFDFYESNGNFEDLELNCLGLRNDFREWFLEKANEDLESIERLEKVLEEVMAMENVQESFIFQAMELEKFSSNVSQEVSKFRDYKEQVEICFSDPTKVDLDFMSTILSSVRHNHFMVDFLTHYSYHIMRIISQTLADPTIMAVIERIFS